MGETGGPEFAVRLGAFASVNISIIFGLCLGDCAI